MKQEHDPTDAKGGPRMAEKTDGKDELQMEWAEREREVVARVVADCIALTPTKGFPCGRFG
jgi:hypothetical protein